MTYEELLQCKPFDVNQRDKDKILRENLLSLTEYHRTNCPAYARMMNLIDFRADGVNNVADIPFLPVRLFKEFELSSIPREQIFKTMTSSGTSGQRVSKIFLDKDTALNQQKTLTRIVTEFTGSARMPLIIIDCPSVIKNRAMFSARGAGILGFSIFGRKSMYALTDDMNLNIDALLAFIDENRGKKILLFGFTYMVWRYFYETLHNIGLKLDLSGGILIHGGGWKKLAEQAVSPEKFKEGLKSVCNVDRVINYYGMVEQTGCIYVECEAGHLHASTYSDVIFRRAEDFSPCEIGERGIIQVVSLLPKSYPGHSLLTEDEGVLLGVDDCPCGRKGKYFKLLGRLSNAELRGCSDTYAAEH